MRKRTNSHPQITKKRIHPQKTTGKLPSINYPLFTHYSITNKHTTTDSSVNPITHARQPTIFPKQKRHQPNSKPHIIPVRKALAASAKRKTYESINRRSVDYVRSAARDRGCSGGSADALVGRNYRAARFDACRFSRCAAISRSPPRLLPAPVREARVTRRLAVHARTDPGYKTKSSGSRSSSLSLQRAALMFRTCGPGFIFGQWFRTSFLGWRFVFRLSRGFRLRPNRAERCVFFCKC